MKAKRRKKKKCYRLVDFYKYPICAVEIPNSLGPNDFGSMGSISDSEEEEEMIVD